MPHRKTVRRVHEPGHFHELTFSCYRRLPLLTNHDWRTRLARGMDAASHQTGVELAAFVFMPEHVHLLVLPTWPDASSISVYLARVKQSFSREIKVILDRTNTPLRHRLTVRERPDKTCFRFWQEGGGYDRNLFTPRAIRASLDYLHANPVRRGLCRRAVDWRWSSARYYENEPTGVQEPELPRIDGLPGDALVENAPEYEDTGQASGTHQDEPASPVPPRRPGFHSCVCSAAQALKTTFVHWSFLSRKVL